MNLHCDKVGFPSLELSVEVLPRASSVRGPFSASGIECLWLRSFLSKILHSGWIVLGQRAYFLLLCFYHILSNTSHFSCPLLPLLWAIGPHGSVTIIAWPPLQLWKQGTWELSFISFSLISMPNQFQALMLLLHKYFLNHKTSFHPNCLFSWAQLFSSTGLLPTVRILFKSELTMAPSSAVSGYCKP